MSQVKAHTTETAKKGEPTHRPEQKPADRAKQGVAQNGARQVAYQQAQVNPAAWRPSAVLALQRAVGNQVVQRLLEHNNGDQQMRLLPDGRGNKLQPKLNAGCVTVQRQHVQTVSGRYVGDLPGVSSNLREEVLLVMDRLHSLWSLSNADYGVEYPRVAALPPRSQVPVADLRLTIAALSQNEAPTLNPGSANSCGLRISGTVGQGQANSKADILALQDTLHRGWHLSNADYASERAAVNGGPDPVPERAIPETIRGITSMKIALVAGTSHLPGGLLVGTRVVGPAERTRVEAALITPGTAAAPGSATTAPFRDRVGGRTYRQDLERTLDRYRVAFFPSSQALLRRRRLPMSRFEGIGQEAKRRVDAVFGRYASGPAFRAGVPGSGANLIDRSLQTPSAEDLVRYLVDNDEDFFEPIRRSHSADHSRPTEQRIVEDVIRDYPNISAHHRRQLEVIDQAWPGIQDPQTHTIEIQPFAGANRGATRRMFWEQFQTLIHEYLHSVTHPNYTRVAGLLGADRRSVLIEGGTSLFATEVWRSIYPSVIRTDARLRANVEGQTLPYDPSVISPTVLGNYPSQELRAGQIVHAIGAGNLRAAYFLGRTEFLGFPTSRTSGRSFVVPPTGVRTVADVAFMTGASAEVIAAANSIAPSATVRPGQRLTVPGI